MHPWNKDKEYKNENKKELLDIKNTAAEIKSSQWKSVQHMSIIVESTDELANTVAGNRYQGTSQGFWTLGTKKRILKFCRVNNFSWNNFKHQNAADFKITKETIKNWSKELKSQNSIPNQTGL